MLTAICLVGAVLLFVYKVFIMVLAWTGKLIPVNKTPASTTTPPAVDEVFYLESIQAVLQPDRTHAHILGKDVTYQEEMSSHG
jgi:hypothetical protein